LGVAVLTIIGIAAPADCVTDAYSEVYFGGGRRTRDLDKM
jgi:hypothetical protein